MARGRDSRGRFLRKDGTNSGRSYKDGIRDVDKGYKKIVADLRSNTHSRNVRVGIQGDEASAAEHDGPITNVQLGVIHEFGVPQSGIPERSFIRSTYDQNIKDYGTLLRKGAAAVYAGKITAGRVVGRLGEKLVGHIKKKIADGIDPPLSFYTVLARLRKRKKYSDKPLLDTGQLRDSVTWRFEQPGEADAADRWEIR